MQKAALFDMDGLMFDTERIMDTSWKQAGEQFGIKVTDEMLTSCRGTNAELTKKICVNAFGEKFDFAAFHQKTRELTHARLEQQVPHRPGLLLLLNYLKDEGYKMAVASSTRSETVKKHLKKAGVEHFFSVVIGGDLVQNSKPAPDIFLKAAYELGVSPVECIALEDSFNGIKSANAAGCRTFMIPDINAPTEEITALCEAVLPSLDRVIKYLEDKK